jgi:hypothetical protein
MTDRELLELAAKAAGMKLNKRDGFIWCEKVGPKNHWGLWRDVAIPTINDPNQRYLPGCWNPLTDDGDALRLAVQLGLDIEIYKTSTHVYDDRSEKTFEEDHDGDPYAATRRAIVRAAALGADK